MQQAPRVLIIGLGLIGASFGRVLKQKNAAYVLGYDNQDGVAQQAIELDVIDEAVADLGDVNSVDVVVMAVPVKAIGPVVSQIKHLIDQLTVLTDVASVKLEVVRAVQKQLGELPSCFVPGHPIAGIEKSGVTAAKADLFERHIHILTPLESSNAEAVDLITKLWQVCGAQVVTMPLERHDEVLAATSHLPHLLAFSLVDTLSRESENREIFTYAASGFRDFSRIASSDPTMWHDICLTNKDAILKVMGRFQSDLAILSEAIEHADGDLLRTIFTRAKSSRDYFTDLLEARSKL